MTDLILPHNIVLVADQMLHVNCDHVLPDGPDGEVADGAVAGPGELVKAVQSLVNSHERWVWCAGAQVLTTAGFVPMLNYTAMVDNGLDNDGDPDIYYITLSAPSPFAAMRAIEHWVTDHCKDEIGEDADDDEIAEWMEENPMNVAILSDGIPHYRTKYWNHFLSVGDDHCLAFFDNKRYELPEPFLETK